MKKARAAAFNSTAGTFSIFDTYKKLHDIAKKAAREAIKADVKELPESIGVSNSIFKNGEVLFDADAMVIGVHLMLGKQKGIFTRRLSSLFKGRDGNAGVMALKAYVQAFMGKEYADKVTHKTVYNGFDATENRVVYYIGFELDTSVH